MSNGKVLALIMLIASSSALYLHTQGKLLPSLEVIVAPTNDTISIGKLAVAFITLLFVLTVLTPKQGILLGLVVLTGGLIYSEKILRANQNGG